MARQRRSVPDSPDFLDFDGGPGCFATIRNFLLLWVAERFGLRRLIGCGCLIIIIGAVTLVYAVSQILN